MTSKFSVVQLHVVSVSVVQLYVVRVWSKCVCGASMCVFVAKVCVCVGVWS